MTSLDDAGAAALLALLQPELEQPAPLVLEQKKAKVAGSPDPYTGSSGSGGSDDGSAPRKVTAAEQAAVYALAVPARAEDFLSAAQHVATVASVVAASLQIKVVQATPVSAAGSPRPAGEDLFAALSNAADAAAPAAPWRSYTFLDAAAPAALAQKQARAKAMLRFRQKKAEGKFSMKVRYTSRKNIAVQRPRVKGRFVKTGEIVRATKAGANCCLLRLPTSALSTPAALPLLLAGLPCAMPLLCGVLTCPAPQASNGTKSLRNSSKRSRVSERF